MESIDKYFIVTRTKTRKGFSRGSIGRIEAETQTGDIVGLVYGSGGGTAKSGGLLKREETYPLTRHQAQLLLFVSPASRRLEILCNQMLFKVICELAQDDLVMVRYKKGFQPCLVKNLMQIGRKDGSDDLNMLGFELQPVVCSLSPQNPDKLSSKKPAPLPVFSAADIIQVAQSSTKQPLRDNHTIGINRRTVSRINSLPIMGSRNGFLGKKISSQNTPDIKSLSNTYQLDVGSMVEMASNRNVILYGVIRWIGVPAGQKGNWAGIELDDEVGTCTDGTFHGQRYFTCQGNRAAFVPLEMCVPDGRFHSPSPSSSADTEESPRTPIVTPIEEDKGEEDVPPLTESEVLRVLEGKMKGIQGHFNSCYLDATLFSLFTSSVTLDRLLQSSANAEMSICRQMRRDIVNQLRRHGFVPAENVMNFRKQLGCNTYVTEEKDPEEFIAILFQRVLQMDPLLKIRFNGDSGSSQDAYTHQIILEKNDVGPCPSVQQLLETSFMSCNLKFEEVPLCLMVQMPRFGKNFKMFPCIIPSTELDITDLLHQSPRECFICGHLAQHECTQCFRDRKLPGRIKQYCSTCNTQVHSHPSRQGHTPRSLALPVELSVSSPVSRTHMQLFAVLCIQTSHYVSFVKYGPEPQSWMFFDSMADRSGDDHTGYNIPEVRACPEVGDFLSQSEEDLACINLSQTSGLVRRLLCDSFMCLYQQSSR
ncbi:ubiquitin carboxyl-terminal hydrolase CYLD isoform X2 [Alosa sapidissima]|uniref:ubiquitin carboxyl-terminal hydrolase CYLD isoform X2 n=1 Tax=Alosa sapidissima TaxID=34773 RepID=UPI001C090474|nr:ubiquitin carboxyl-terminal hydrolase CYLD isoform X2 [Alosa sapidissima]